MPLAPSFEKIVVTGGTGFIGRHLLEVLVAGGHSPVVIVRRLDQTNDLPEFLKERVSLVELDLVDSDAVSRVIEVERPSLLFHLAGTKGTDDENRNAALTCRELNVDATLHLLEVATRAGAGRIIITGSAEEYGKQTGPFDETHLLKPTSDYGKSKADATRLALELYERIKCPVVILRLFTVYGPHQPQGMFVSDAIASAVNNVSFSMSEGLQQRDLVYVDDVTSALIAAATMPGIEGKVFNLGSGRPVRLLDLAHMIWNISNTSAALKVGSRGRKSDEMQVTWSDSSLALKDLGWSAKVDLEAGLRATIEWAKNGGVR